MWFRNLLVYRLTQDIPFDAEALEVALASKPARPCASQELTTYGFTAPFGKGADAPLVHVSGDFLLIGARKEERILPGSVLRQLAPEEMEAYRQPFPTPASRRPILSLPRELPIAGEPADVHAISTADHAALRASTYPKLLFSGDPGALISPQQAREFAAGLTNCRLVELGGGAHYLQEDHPIAIGDAVRDWLIAIGIAQAPDIRGRQAAAC